MATAVRHDQSVYRRATSADFGKLISDETKKWGKVIVAANIKAK